MSRTTGTCSLRVPGSFPHIEQVIMEASVTTLGSMTEEGCGRVSLSTGPTWRDSPMVRRRVVISRDENPQLDFPVRKAGECDEFLGEKAYFFLEQV